MVEVDVIAVVGVCAPERLRYAKRLAVLTDRTFWPATRLALSPDPVDEALALAPWADRPAGVVLEFPGEVPAVELIGGLAAPDGRIRLSAMVCVLDAAHLLADLSNGDYLRRPVGAHPAEFIARAMLTVTQIEYASTVVIVNWRRLGRDDLSTVLALVAHLGPKARPVLHQDTVERIDSSERYEPGQDRPGWVGILNDDFTPPFTDSRVRSLRYENVRPFHPGRLQRVLDDRIADGEFGTVIRSAGFCRLATRPGITAQWEHVGQMISFEPLALDDRLGDDDELLALGQDLAFTGLDLNAGGLRATLDEATLTDAELADGPTAWARFPDSFPVWATADSPE